MADSGDQPSGFWTLTRPTKLYNKRRNSDLHELHHKVFNIGVVGLSGTEKEKGPIGIGKSCLCNRFIRSAADDYHTDHISVLSQSDFGGRIVNNDHWLYWGSVIKSCDGYDLAFNVIEQTEFIDDICFQPFKSGKTEPYHKRCANTKLVSPEKLMYICKSQLGIEREYEQRYLPDGKFNVDGFLCLFDVSEVQGRSIDQQIEMTNLILLNLMKTRKPVVFVTTKHDEASELLVNEAERLINQRDFRGLIPVVETSAQENVNVNMAFLVCAQLIDKTRAKIRVPPFFEAYNNHSALLNAASDAYLGLIRSVIVDYRSSWQQVCIKLSHNPEFLQYTYLHGLDKAAQVFKNHIRRLLEDCVNQKVQSYLKIFPDILNEMIPRANDSISKENSNSIEAMKLKELNSSSVQAYELAKDYIKCHPMYEKYFVPVPENVSWYETDLLQSIENRIPSDWLNSDEAYAVFQQRNLQLESAQKRQSTRETFAQLLIDSRIPVGKPFMEVKHIFAGSSSLEILNDQELFEIYVEYQNNLLQQARADFQELLLENADHLQQLTSSDKVIRQEDIKTINAILQHDERYQALDRFDQDRTLMMIRHLSFLHSQISEQCPSYPSCIEPEIERLLITKAKALVSRFNDSRPDKAGLNTQKTCDIIILGPRRPSQQLILALNVLNSRAPKTSQYQITFTVLDNADEVDTQIQRFKQSSDTRPSGCFGIFTNRRSLEYVGYTLEKFLILNSKAQSDQKRNHFGGPPIVMLYAADITLDERTMLALENEGQQMADRFKCPFMNVTAIDQYRQHQQNNIINNEQNSTSQVMSECASLDYACVDAAFNVLKEAISRRVCFMELYNNQDLIPRQAFNPDARILMCLLCGEPYSNELFLWKMFLDYEDCYVTSSKSICFRIRLDNGQERFFEVTITSYTHGAYNYKEDLLHGFILVCSTQRRASVAILNAFSFNIPCTPVLVMAVDDSSSKQVDVLEGENLRDEANDAAKRLKGHFDFVDLSTDGSSHTRNNLGIVRFKKFLKSVIERKPTIERAYELGDMELPPLSAATTSTTATTTKSLDDELQSDPRQRFEFDQKQKHRAQFSQDNHDYRADKSNGFLQLKNESSDKPTTTSVSRTLFHLQQQQQQPQQTPRSRPQPQPSSRRLLKKTSEDAQLCSATSSDSHSDQQHQIPTEELYAKRPLPPIPAASNPSTFDKQTTSIHSDIDRDVELSTTTSRTPPTSGTTTTNVVNNNIISHHNDLHQNISSKKKIEEKSFASSMNNEPPQSAQISSAADDENDYSSESSTDLDTEDSQGNKLDKPKPGRLDLRQFDNITTAIGKLNVQTSSSGVSTGQTPTTTATISNSQSTTSTTKSSSIIMNQSSKPNTRRIQKNLRQNHGRAVAPPQLPPTTPTTTGGLLRKEESNDHRNPLVRNETISQLTDENNSSAIDFSQSPIAQRLLKHSKDHKVSELNSPYESDCEPQQPSGRLFNRAQELSKESVFKRNSSIDSSELCPNSRGAAIRTQLNEILAKQPPPGRPVGIKNHALLNNNQAGSLDQAHSNDRLAASEKKITDKDNKKDKKKLRSDEKLEKRKLKEEERLRRQEEEKQRRQEKKLASKKSKSNSVNSNTVDDDGIPLFIKRCIEFIEFEGLDAEGIYRVPGNRAHVDTFVQKFKDNPDMSIVESDIPVNAVATALKDFLSKKWGPIIPLNLMNELTELSNISDKERRVEAVKELIMKLPTSNYRLLKYVFSHFVKVSHNHSLNSMDSKNLAICWWPTLLPLHFNDMVMFEQMRPHLEESIQTMIDRYEFIFDNEEPISTTVS